MSSAKTVTVPKIPTKTSPAKIPKNLLNIKHLSFCFLFIITYTTRCASFFQKSPKSTIMVYGTKMAKAKKKDPEGSDFCLF